MRSTILTILLCTWSSDAQWIQQYSGTTVSLNSVCFTDINTGYIVGGILASNDQAFLKTTNGGSNWYEVQTGDTNYLYSINFLNSNTGFACGANGTVLRTTDAGNDWGRLDLGINNYLYDIHFSGNTGLLVGSGKVLRTTNYGSSWTTLYSASGKGAAIYYSVFLLNDVTAMISGWITVSGGPYIMRSTNAGTNWSSFTYVAGVVNDFDFSDINTGYFPGANGIVYKSTNGGINWSPQNFGNTTRLSSISAITSDVVTVVGDSGKIYRTTNGGTNWIIQTSPVNGYLRSVFFVDPDIGYSVGVNGKIIKTTNGGVTSAQPISNEVPEEFSLNQNYPNPFNPATKIRFDVPSISQRHAFDLQLVIYDILGRKVAVLVNEQLQPGTYEVNWDASNYPSGVYYYTIIAGNALAPLSTEFTKTRKMILLR